MFSFTFFGKMDEINKYGQKSRSMPRRGEACPCLGEADRRLVSVYIKLCRKI